MDSEDEGAASMSQGDMSESGVSGADVLPPSTSRLLFDNVLKAAGYSGELVKKMSQAEKWQFVVQRNASWTYHRTRTLLTWKKITGPQI